MIPARLKHWILIWTPLLWLLLELVWYPKNRYVSQGVWRILGGFIDGRIGSYPAWTLLAAAMVFLGWGIATLLKDVKARRLGVVITGVGALLLAWALIAGGLPGWSPGQRSGSFGWLFQMALLVLLACGVRVWAVTNPESAESMVWNIREVWHLFRSNWLGILGLCVLVVFVLLALLAPFLAAHSYLSPNAMVTKPFGGPSFSYYKLFGGDEQGQSILAEFIWSARISLAVGLVATLISTVIGTLMGIGSGFLGGWRGEVGMRTTDVFLVLPWLPFAMVLAAAWGRSYVMIIVIIGVTSWPGTARLVRAETLKLRKLQFVERAKAIGSSDSHIMRRHILPNVFSLIFANTILVVAIAILSETTLSFLGLGDALNFSWGTMLRNSWASGAAGLPEWLYLLPPGIAIVLVVLAFTFVGQALDEVLDPKLRKREESGGDNRFAKSPDVAIPVGPMGAVVITDGLDTGHPTFGHSDDKGGPQ